MARAKRDNASKLTISLDTDILILIKHKCIDTNSTMSDYIQELCRRDLMQVKDIVEQEENKVGTKGKSNLKPVIKKPIVISEPILGTDLFSDKVIDIKFKECIAEILEFHQRGITKVEIAKQVNAKGYKTQTNKEWNRQSIKWAIDKYSTNEV